MAGREHYPEDRPRAATVRSRMMLEVASELVGREDFAPKQVRVSFRAQGSDTWDLALFGSDSLLAAHDVAEGVVDFAIVNPATIATKAQRGVAPFQGPIPLRAVATIPSHDQLGLAISRDVGIDTLTGIAAERPALRVSLRGARPDHSVHAVVDDMLAAAGFGLDDLRKWGGEVIYHSGIPHQEPRLSAIRDGEVDLLIDEGIYNWVDLAIDSGFEFLAIDEGALASLEADGYRRSMIEAPDYELLTQDIVTLDFSGFLVYTHERVPDEMVTAFCEAMDTRQDRIPWQGGATLPLRRMVSDAEDAPVPIPFHRAAEAFWRSRGYLD